MERTLIHERTYEHALAQLGTDIRRLDDALTGVEWALATNPEVYEIVRGTRFARLLKTEPLGGLPPLRVWFRIDEDGHHVHLDYIEAIEQGI
jgi:hypothetical protein